MTIDYDFNSLDEFDDHDFFKEALAQVQEELAAERTSRGGSGVWEPNPGPQHQFLASRIDDILFGGAAGGGKTSALAAMPMKWAKIEGFYSITFRRERPQLVPLIKEGTRLYGVPPKLSPYIHWDWPNGVQFRLAHCARLDDAYKYQGQEFHLLCIDELTHMLRPMFDELRSRVRGADPRYPMRGRYTSNPGGAGHCVPFGEVLTPSGWVDIRDMRVGDPVFTVKAGGELAETVVDQTHCSWYEGELVEVSARGLSMACTPNHRVAKVGGVRLKTKRAFSLMPISELPGQATVLRSCARWDGADPDRYIVPRRPYDQGKQPLELPFGEYAELMGWVLSEGNVLCEPQHKWFSIAQMKTRGRDAIRALLQRNGFKFTEGKTAFTVHSVSWAHDLIRFGKCRDKFIPDQLKRATRPTLQRLLNALMDGDGHWQNRGQSGIYYTTSARLADDVAEVCLKLGLVVRQFSRQRPHRVGLEHQVQFKRVKSGGTELLTGNHRYRVATRTKRRSDVRKTRYSGPVFCIGVKGTHTFLIRQKGSVWVSGNSWVFEMWGPWLNPEFDHPLLPPRYDEETGERLPPARPGQPLWVHSTLDGEDIVKPGTKGAQTRTFIPALLEDNPALLRADPNYEQRLMSMADPVRRRQLRKGDWLVRYAPGLLFKAAWCDVIDHLPADACMVRFWDLAALDPKRSKIEGDPDYVCGVLLAVKDWFPLVGVNAWEPSAPFIVAHVCRFRDTPKNIMATIQRQAALDRAACKGVYTIGVEEEGGSAGKFVADAMLDALKQFHVDVDRPTGDKVARFGPFSAQAEHRRVALYGGHWPSAREESRHWLQDYIWELESFPSEDVHDDQVDATSGAFKVMTSRMPLLVHAWKALASRGQNPLPTVR